MRAFVFLSLLSVFVFASCLNKGGVVDDKSFGTPEQALQKFREHMKSGNKAEIKEMVAKICGEERLANRINRFYRMAEAMKDGRWDFEIVCSKSEEDCAVVIIIDKKKDNTIVDYDPLYLLINGGGWKILPSPTSFDEEYYSLTEAQKSRYNNLAEWYEKKERELKLKAK